MAATAQDDGELLRRAIDARVRAVRAKDAEALLAAYAPHVRTFDLVEPLVNDGVEAVHARVQQWFDSFVTPIDYEVSDIVLLVSGDVAFDHHLVHVAGTNATGDRVEMWFRETVGYRKVDGRWMVVHQHSSVPLDMRTMAGRLDLVPPRASKLSGES